MDRRQATRVAVGLLCALSLGGCASSWGPDPFPDETGLDQDLRIDVRNLNNEDVTLWVMGLEGARRLGTVSREHHGVFLLDWTQAAELRVRVEILAGPQYTTNALSVAPGDRVEVVVPSKADQSYLVRR